MAKVLITTVPFADNDRLPIELLENAKVDYVINPLGRKLKEEELANMVGDFDVLIAGTEPITSLVMSKARNLKLISRVGIGLDGVDLLKAKKRNILVSYTPDAPAPAVSELTLGLILSLLRQVNTANLEMHRGEWVRHFGRRISDVVIGVIGLGRIGSRVFDMLRHLNHLQILVNDIQQEVLLRNDLPNCRFVDKEVIYREADVITLHVPLTRNTMNMISFDQLRMMKSNAVVVNTSRGGIINEEALFSVMKEGHLSGAAIDVFEQEPYAGNLKQIERCLLTSHMGSMSYDCRAKMEIEATKEAIRFLRGEELKSLVPEAEYLTRL